MGKALDAEERLHVCFTINASIISVKHFACDLFHFRYLFKMRCNSLKCFIIFVVRKQVLCHYFNELSFFVVYKEKNYMQCGWTPFQDKTFRYEVDTTIVSGQLAWHQNQLFLNCRRQALEINR